MYQQNGVYFSQEHSISFGNLVDRTTYIDFNVTADTWNTWHLIPASRIAIAHPKVVTKFVEMSGYNGMLDLTEFLNNKPNYGQRTGSFSFYLDTNQGNVDTIHRSMISNLHGKRLKMRLQDDPGYYYEGRYTVGNFEYGDKYPKITINYQLDPYKLKINTEGHNQVIWDTFNFERDYDYSVFVNGITVNNNTKRYRIYAGDYAFAVIVYWVSGSVTASFGGVSKTLSSSGSVELGKASPGANTLTVSGTGKIKIEWRGGSL